MKVDYELKNKKAININVGLSLKIKKIISFTLNSYEFQ